MFEREKLLDVYNKANAALELERGIVGVKFLFTKNEFENDDSEGFEGKNTFCRMVLRASRGESVKVNFDNFGCFGGARALGIVDLDEYYSSGRFFQVCGLYQDLATARDISVKMSICDHKIYGVTVKPLNKFNVAPDVVIIIANPRNAMRIIQGYSHFFGTKSDYKFVGNQAVCSELTARPYLQNDINVSLLCRGPRTCGFEDHEMGVGIVYNKFPKVVEGICMTITPVESNPEKDVLIERFKEKRNR